MKTFSTFCFYRIPQSLAQDDMRILELRCTRQARLRCSLRHTTLSDLILSSTRCIYPPDSPLLRCLYFFLILFKDTPEASVRLIDVALESQTNQIMLQTIYVTLPLCLPLLFIR